MNGRYDELLASMRPQVEQHLAANRKLLLDNDLHPEGFQLPLRPVLLDPAGLATLQSGVSTLYGALVKLFCTEFRGDVRRVARLIRMPEPAQELCEWFRPETAGTELFGRPDAFQWADQLRFIEQNLTSAAGGIARVDALARFFADFPPVRAMGLRPLSPIDAYVEYFTAPDLRGLSVGYLDAVMPDGSLYDNDGLTFMAALAERGVDLVDITFASLRADSSGLYADGTRIDVVYRGALGTLLYERTPELAPLFDACRRGVARMVMSPYDAVLFDKLLLAYLSDERLTDVFTAAERAALDRVVPWTRIVRDDVSTLDGHRAYVTDLCCEHRRDLVLKRGDSYGSEAVVIGAECTPVDWAGHVTRAADDGNWIVQRLVAPPRERVPYLVDGDLVHAEVLSMTCPFVVAGRVAGVACRTGAPDGGRILANAGLEGSGVGLRPAVI
jgi:hypothetical protein